MPWAMIVGRTISNESAAQSIAVHQTSSPLAVSMSIRISLSTGWAWPPWPGSEANFTHSIGTLNELSFQTLLEPVR